MITLFQSLYLKQHRHVPELHCKLQEKLIMISSKFTECLIILKGISLSLEWPNHAHVKIQSYDSNLRLNEAVKPGSFLLTFYTEK